MERIFKAREAVSIPLARGPPSVTMIEWTYKYSGDLVSQSPSYGADLRDPPGGIFCEIVQTPTPNRI